MNIKTYREKKAEIARKSNHKIWKLLNIEKVVKVHGFEATKRAIGKWLEYQRTNAKLLKEKRALEQKLNEIEGKL